MRRIGLKGAGHLDVREGAEPIELQLEEPVGMVERFPIRRRVIALSCTSVSSSDG